MLTFVPSDVIINRVKDDLPSYNDAGLIDEDICFGYIVAELAKLGGSMYEELEAECTVTNYIAKLPDHTKIIDEVWYKPSCNNKFENVKKIPLYPEDIVKPKRVQRVPVWNPFSSSVHHHHSSLQQHVPHVYKLEKNTIRTHYENGNLLLRYRGIRVENGIPFVTEDDFIQQFLITAVKYRLFENWYFDNIVPDIQQRYKEIAAKYKFELADTISYIKTPTFASLVRIKTDGKYNNLPFWK